MRLVTSVNKVADANIIGVALGGKDKQQMSIGCFNKAIKCYNNIMALKEGIFLFCHISLDSSSIKRRAHAKSTTTDVAMRVETETTLLQILNLKQCLILKKLS